MKIDILRAADWLPTLASFRLPMNGLGDLAYYKETGELADKDLKLLKRLFKAGPDHAKSLRGAWVTLRIEAPRYWWSEMDTYCIGRQPLSSTSTMHKITSRDLVHSDFEDNEVSTSTLNILNMIRKDSTLSGTDKLIAMKRRLPESFLQTRVVQFNYPSLSNIYAQRVNHRLPEWTTFCDKVSELQYFDDLINKKYE